MKKDFNDKQYDNYLAALRSWESWGILNGLDIMPDGVDCRGGLK